MLHAIEMLPTKYLYDSTNISKAISDGATTLCKFANCSSRERSRLQKTIIDIDGLTDSQITTQKMYNITLIGTIHSENGQCNHDELYNILEDINPEVIFDEIPGYFFDMYYGDSFDAYYINNILLNRHPPEVPLEVKCIKKYKQNHNITILPVDIDVRERLSQYQNEISFMFLVFYKYEEYNKLDREKETLIAQEGFHYLNSDNFLDFLEKKEGIEKKIMESEIQKNRLIDIYKLFRAEQYDNRENAMLDNIYNYSKENQYNQAVFLIGAEHKKSILQKITEYEKLSGIKLNWTMYDNK